MRARPALRYHGGKWRLAPWVIGFFPPHRVYVEPFGGAGHCVPMLRCSVVQRKRRKKLPPVIHVYQVCTDGHYHHDLIL